MGVRLTTPVGLPTESTTAEEKAWSTLVSEQLANARKSAENWRNGLVAMSGLIAAVSVVKGPDQIGGLDAPFGYAVGALVALALVCAVFGTWYALSAAYGTPTPVTRLQVRAQGGVTGFKLNLAQRCASHLRIAQRATVSTLVFLVIAVGLTWYAPHSPTVVLEVTRPGFPDLCGTLVASQNGYIDLKPEAAQAVRLRLADLIQVRAVSNCR